MYKCVLGLSNIFTWSIYTVARAIYVWCRLEEGFCGSECGLSARGS